MTPMEINDLLRRGWTWLQVIYEQERRQKFGEAQR